MKLSTIIRETGDRALRGWGRMLDHLLPLEMSDAVGVLLFHRVGDFQGDPTWNVRTRQFEHIIRRLLERGWAPLRLSDVLTGNKRHRRGFVVTFDDGYRSVVTHAMPVLQRLQVPATVFLTTGEVDQQAHFSIDDWELRGHPSVASEAWMPLTTAECRALHETGLFEFGSHTHSHADFRGNMQAFWDDLETSRAWLQSRGLAGESIPFAFPYGNSALGFCGPDFVHQVQQAELACALTSDPELIVSTTDRYRMGRFLVRSEDTPDAVYHRLSGWYVRSKRLVRRVSAAAQLLFGAGKPEFRQQPSVHPAERCNHVTLASSEADVQTPAPEECVPRR